MEIGVELIDLIPLLLQANAAANPSQVYVNAGSIFTEQTITVLLQLLVILAISMQIARPYFLRILRKFTLRLAADIWWLLFILLRDASIFLIVFLGAELFWPGTYGDYPVAVPFQPLAVDFFAMALVLMIVKDTDEEPKWNNLLTTFVAIGSLLYMFGTIFVTESAVFYTGAALPPTVSMGTGNFWGFMNMYFNSQNNPALAIYTFYVTLAILAICGGIVVRNAYSPIAPKQPGTPPEPQPKPVPMVKQT